MFEVMGKKMDSTQSLNIYLKKNTAYNMEIIDQVKSFILKYLNK